MRALIVPACLLLAACQTAQPAPPPEPPRTREEACSRLMAIVSNGNVRPATRMMAYDALTNMECLGRRPPVRIEVR